MMKMRCTRGVHGYGRGDSVLWNSSCKSLWSFVKDEFCFKLLFARLTNFLRTSCIQIHKYVNNRSHNSTHPEAITSLYLLHSKTHTKPCSANRRGRELPFKAFIMDSLNNSLLWNFCTEKNFKKKIYYENLTSLFNEASALVCMGDWGITPWDGGRPSNPHTRTCTNKFY